MGEKLTLEQCATEAHTSIRGVRKLVAHGVLRASRIGSSTAVYIDSDDLATMLNAPSERARQILVSRPGRFQHQR
jgi:hypothetical protein